MNKEGDEKSRTSALTAKAIRCSHDGKIYGRFYRIKVFKPKKQNSAVSCLDG